MIKIIEEDIIITRADYDKYMDEWRKVCMYSVNPPSFESYVFQRKRELNEQKQQLLSEGSVA